MQSSGSSKRQRPVPTVTMDAEVGASLYRMLRRAKMLPPCQGCSERDREIRRMEKEFQTLEDRCFSRMSQNARDEHFLRDAAHHAVMAVYQHIEQACDITWADSDTATGGEVACPDRVVAEALKLQADFGGYR